MVRVVDASREDDELVLALLALRNKGYGMTATAQKLQCDRAFVSVATNQVLNADLKYSGEPAGLVRKAYW